MSQDRVIRFGEVLGDQVKGSSPKKLESSVIVLGVLHVNIHVLSFNVILISSPWRVPRPSYPFLGNFGRSGKARSPKKLKLLREVPCVVHVKVHVLSFNMILISFP